MRSKILTPFWLPVWIFAGTIGTGGLLLHQGASLSGGTMSWLDSFFTATSAMCVTGLSVVDTGTHFSLTGQLIILGLIQLGGLGIMTYTSLVVYLSGHRVAMTDRIAVSQSLLHDPTFSLQKFLVRVVVGTLVLEVVGALALWGLDSEGFSPYSALFHSISAFCNAGFSLNADSLTRWRTDWGVNIVFMTLIILGGLGFYVLNECGSVFRKFLRTGRIRGKGKSRVLSWHSSVVLSTSLFLVVAGAIIIFMAEMSGGERFGVWHEELLASLFQSVTCRTAGFNTVEISHLTNVTLVIMLGLMFIGGSPGSCAGGIKTTTFRAWIGFMVSKLRGRSQVKVGRYAIAQGSLNRAFTLFVLAATLIICATLFLNITEGGDVPHVEARGNFLEILFESVSAFGTVGLSTGMTGNLTPIGKIMVMVLMFVGRIGPIWLLSALQSWQTEPSYRIPEDDLPLG